MLCKIYTVDLTWRCSYYEYDLYDLNMMIVRRDKMVTLTYGNQDYLLGVF